MLGSKNIDIEKFVKKEEGSNLPSHRNFISIFYKQNKSDKWYYKQYQNKKLYLNEAAASDFLRFILGKERAAKAQATYNHNDKQINGIISQHNPAGFTNFFTIKAELGKNYIKNEELVQNGKCEVEVAEKILHDTDGLDNEGNSGLNSKDEVSRIDYDYAFCANWSVSTPIIEAFQRNEKLVIDTKNEKIIDRFYKAQIKTVLLNSEAVYCILNRHFGNSKDAEKPFNFILTNVAVLTRALLGSEKFKKFIQYIEFDELCETLKDFFKHEYKNFPNVFYHCLNSIEQSFCQLKTACLIEVMAPIRAGKIE